MIAFISTILEEPFSPIFHQSQFILYDCIHGEKYALTIVLLISNKKREDMFCILTVILSFFFFVQKDTYISSFSIALHLGLPMHQSFS